MDILDGKLQFIRSLELCCRQHNVIWNISGDFIKELIGDKHGDGSGNMEIYLFSSSGRNKDIVKDLQILNIVKDVMYHNNHINPKHYSARVEFIYSNEQKFVFPVLFYLDGYNDAVSSNDQLVLSAHGLSVLILDSNVDYINQTNGIAMLQRIIDMKMKRINLLQSYFNIPGNLVVRRKNAELMLAQNEYINDGYSVYGNNVLDVQKRSIIECPICYECSQNTTTLECGHAFCLKCLASHMNTNELNASTCPMCRSRIVLKIN
jgi:hypothetical protein